MSTSSILVPVDATAQSLNALGPAKALSDQLGCGLHVVSFVPTEELRDDRLADLDTALADRRIEGGNVEVFVDPSPMRREGRPEHSILQLMADRPDDRVCMATHARGSVREAILGSVASEVVRESARPVFLVGPKLQAAWTGPVRTVLLCLDGSALSEAMIEPAARFASDAGAHLMLVQVLEPGVLGSGLTEDTAESAYVQRMAREIRKAYRLAPDWDVLHDDNPATAINRYVAAIPGAVVALTTHGRSGLNRIALGSVVRDVVHGASCPVLTLRPGE